MALPLPRSIDLNGGTIKDVPGNDAVLSFTPPDTSGVLVDGVAPTITSVTGPAAGTYIVGQNLDFTVVFERSGGSYRHTAAATDHRQHDLNMPRIRVARARARWSSATR
jgi:hypothetical protein